MIFYLLLSGFILLVVYSREFGERPSSDVIHLQADDDSYYDSKVIKLRFQAALPTIQRLVANQKLPQMSGSERASYEIDNNDPPPQWWQPKVSAHSLAYSAHRENGDFAQENVWLLYDPQTQIAYYSFFGTD